MLHNLFTFHKMLFIS